MPEFPFFEAKKRKNSLLEKLQGNVNFTFSDFEIIQLDPQEESIGWRLSKRNNPAYFFEYIENKTTFSVQYFPNPFKQNVYSNTFERKNMKAGDGKIYDWAWNRIQGCFDDWINAMVEEITVNQREEELHSAMDPNVILSSDQMQQEFKTENEKKPFLIAADETIYKIKGLRHLTTDQKDLLIDIIDLSKDELKAIKPAAEQTEAEKQQPQITKQQWLNKLKFRIRAAITGARKLLEESIRDLAKDAIKETIRAFIYGHIALSMFSPAQQIEVNIVVNNSFHFVSDNRLELPLGKNTLQIDQGYKWENFEFTDYDEIESKPKKNPWWKLKFPVLLT